MLSITLAFVVDSWREFRIRDSGENVFDLFDCSHRSLTILSKSFDFVNDEICQGQYISTEKRVIRIVKVILIQKPG